MPSSSVNPEGVEPPGTPLEIRRGRRTGDADLVHVTFVPTQAVVRPVAGTADDHVSTSPHAHRFNASLAEADAAIAEWRSFVDEVRSSKGIRSR